MRWTKEQAKKASRPIRAVWVATGPGGHLVGVYAYKRAAVAAIDGRFTHSFGKGWEMVYDSTNTFCGEVRKVPIIRDRK